MSPTPSPVTSPPEAASSRRYDLDWIRVAAFFLLIVYHVGVFYEPDSDWHTSSPRAIEGIEMAMSLSSPWRLALLFLIAGFATRFMTARLSPGLRGAGALARSRTGRLFVPLVFGMLVIVPPQTWFQVAQYTPHLVEPWPQFYALYLSGEHQWDITTPTWNHLWFVAYLWVYSLVLAGLLAVTGDGLPRLGRWLDRTMSGAALLIVPVLYLGLARQLYPVFDRTHALVDDWYLHSVYLPLFLFGFLIARSERIRLALIANRWAALGLALTAWLAWWTYLLTWTGLPGDIQIWTPVAENPPSWLRIAMRWTYAAIQWGAIAAILGFGARHLNFDRPALRYLTVAVFPLYILHQTITVVAGHYLPRLELPLGLEAALLVAITFGGAFAGYELVRRIPPLRPFFGLRFRPRPANRPPRAP
ncbi:MAG: acyltransferase family protein [Brevundimonas sp.]|uniref:acyltransferase family protein n=1 Tax=Brevundimonas sp. TaxID=1871086 RepID=UPI0027331072|nr:acyltransferase family protein [Brevundimonas sp.]MDP3406354.1 acyltransferase family protein [Brevundimonas sp.]